MRTPRPCSIPKGSRALRASASTTGSGTSSRAAASPDVGAQRLHHADQAEGADVRLGDEQDLLGRAGLDELGQHLAREVARVADLAPQLAVRERAGAALAELHVRLRIELALAPQAPGVLGALAHFLAAFEHDRPHAPLR